MVNVVYGPQFNKWDWLVLLIRKKNDVFRYRKRERKFLFASKTNDLTYNHYGVIN